MNWLWRTANILAVAAAAQMPTAAQQAVSFTRDIRPIFVSRCEMCHSAQQQMSGLRLDHRDAALKGGYSGAVIKPGDADNSRLIHLISGADEKVVMPPVGDRLAANEIALLRSWIDQGAEWPAESSEPVSDANKKSTHWAFQPVRRVDPPAVSNQDWVRNEIDRFILARLEIEGIEPAPEAPRATLARRLSLDLTGLPPTPREVDRFLAAKSPDAYEQYVDKLLESPHYGERWAIPWLDLTRYADSDGYERTTSAPMPGAIETG